MSKNDLIDALNCLDRISKNLTQKSEILSLEGIESMMRVNVIEDNGFKDITTVRNNVKTKLDFVKGSANSDDIKFLYFIPKLGESYKVYGLDVFRMPLVRYEDYDVTILDKENKKITYAFIITALSNSNK